MTRSTTKIFVQPNEFSCGPSSLKNALRTLNIRVPYTTLFSLCKTTKNGTNIKDIIRAANQLGLSVMSMQKCTLTHIQSTLRARPGRKLAIIVDYIYPENETEDDSHFAAVAAYSARSGRITMFDSYSGTRKSYLWTDFINRWYGYESRRIKNKNSVRYLSYYKKWQDRHMLILAKHPSHLPKFKNSTIKVFLPKRTRSIPFSASPSETYNAFQV